MADNAGPSFGYAGKIGHVDLSTKKFTVIDTKDYEEWVGGHCLASALFWDYCEDKTVGPFDPGNLLVLATNPMSGTIVPTASSRIEITGIGAFSIPEWYNRSSVGGRIAGGMKRAGFDAFMITGKADGPTWLNVVDGNVTFEDATDLWDMDVWDSQMTIQKIVTGGAKQGEWYNIPGGPKGARTFIQPAVMTIGPISCKLGRMGTISHDANHVTGQTGFGAVWGSKNLKGVSFCGARSFAIADPSGLLNLRDQLVKKITFNVDAPALIPRDGSYQKHLLNCPGRGLTLCNYDYIPSRPEACEGCTSACRSTFTDTKGNEAFCLPIYWGMGLDGHEGMRKNVDLLDRWGINGFEVDIPMYVESLYKRGLAGPGKQIDTGDIDFSTYGTHEFVRQLLTKMVNREGIGDDLADGVVRAAMKWGTWEEDSKTGVLTHPQWGYYEHYAPQVETDWSYGSIFSERDINEHLFNWTVYWMPRLNQKVLGMPPWLTAKENVELLGRTCGNLNPMGWDYSENSMYSDERLAVVAYGRHWTRFWTQSLTFCDWSWYRYNYNDPYGEYEFDCDGWGCKLYTAVTGKGLTPEQALALGEKSYQLDKAIWTLQGRHRDLEVFSEYVYQRPNPEDALYPMFVDGEWGYHSGQNRLMDREKFEDFKTRFYLHEGWDPATGWPTRATLEKFDLGKVADTLEAAGKLGASA